MNVEDEINSLVENDAISYFEKSSKPSEGLGLEDVLGDSESERPASDAQVRTYDKSLLPHTISPGSKENQPLIEEDVKRPWEADGLELLEETAESPMVLQEKPDKSCTCVDEKSPDAPLQTSETTIDTPSDSFHLHLPPDSFTQTQLNADSLNEPFTFRDSHIAEDQQPIDSLDCVHPKPETTQDDANNDSDLNPPTNGQKDFDVASISSIISEGKSGSENDDTISEHDENQTVREKYADIDGDSDDESAHSEENKEVSTGTSEENQDAPTPDTQAPHDKEALDKETQRLTEASTPVLPEMKCKPVDRMALVEKLRRRQQEVQKQKEQMMIQDRPMLTADCDSVLISPSRIKKKKKRSKLTVIPPSSLRVSEIDPHFDKPVGSIRKRANVLEALRREALRVKTIERRKERERVEVIRHFDEDEGFGEEQDETNGEERPAEKNHDDDADLSDNEKEWRARRQAEANREEQRKKEAAAHIADDIPEDNLDSGDEMQPSTTPSMPKDNPFSRSKKKRKLAPADDIYSSDEEAFEVWDPDAENAVSGFAAQDPSTISAPKEMRLPVEDTQDLWETTVTTAAQDMSTQPESNPPPLVRDPSFHLFLNDEMDTPTALNQPSVSENPSSQSVDPSVPEPIPASSTSDEASVAVNTPETTQEARHEETLDRNEEDDVEMMEIEKANSKQLKRTIRGMIEGEAEEGEDDEHAAEKSKVRKEDLLEERVVHAIEKDEARRLPEFLAPVDEPDVQKGFNHRLRRDWDEAEDKRREKTIMRQLEKGSGRGHDTDGMERREKQRQNQLLFGRKKRRVAKVPQLMPDISEGNANPLMSKILSTSDGEDEEVTERTASRMSASSQEFPKRNSKITKSPSTIEMPAAGMQSVLEDDEQSREVMAMIQRGHERRDKLGKQRANSMGTSSKGGRKGKDGGVTAFKPASNLQNKNYVFNVTSHSQESTMQKNTRTQLKKTAQSEPKPAPLKKHRSMLSLALGKDLKPRM